MKIPARLRPVVAHLREARSGEAVGISGVPGSGKSEGLKAAVEAGAIGPTVLVFDPLGRRDMIEFRRGNPEVRHPWGALGPVVGYREFVARAAELLRRPGVYVIDPEGHGEQLMGRRFSRVCEIAFAYGACDVIGEEAGHYARAATEAVNVLATASRHAGVRLYLVAQRLMRIPADARGNLARMILHSMGRAASDVEEVRRTLGRDVAEHVARLGRHDPPYLWALAAAPYSAAQGESR